MNNVNSTFSTEGITTNVRNTNSKYKTIFRWILYIILCVAIFTSISYCCYQKYAALAAQNNILNNKVNELTFTTMLLQNAQHNTEQTVEKLRQHDVIHSTLSLLSTVERLTITANTALQTENDIRTAHMLLTCALSYINSDNNSNRNNQYLTNFFAIKQSLENDLALLSLQLSNTNNTSDNEKIILQLHALHEQIGALEQNFNFSPQQHLSNNFSNFIAPIAISNSALTHASVRTPTRITSQSTTNISVPSSTPSTSYASQLLSWSHIFSTWQNMRVLHQAAYALRNVIIISHKEQLPVALTSAQLVNLRLNAQSLLLEAIWAVNNHQEKIYQQAIKDTASLLQTYFPANENVQNVIYPSLYKLRQANVGLKPYNVDKTVSLIKTTLTQEMSSLQSIQHKQNIHSTLQSTSYSTS